MTYETEEDRENERKIMRFLEKIFKCEIKKTKDGRIDTTVHELTGRMVALMELKTRPTFQDRYTHLNLDLAKVEYGIELGRKLTLPFWVCFWRNKLDGKVMRCRVYNPWAQRENEEVVPYEKRPVVRKGRGDRFDTDPGAWIHLCYFETVGVLE